MQNTTYFNYNLPETDDRAQISYLNSNFTNLDATLHNAIGENYSSQSNLDSRVTALENSVSLPTLYDETGDEHQIGIYMDSQGNSTPIYRKLITGDIYPAITPQNIFASSYYDNNERPEEAFDGIKTSGTGWLPAATSNPSYIGIHLDAPVVFGKCDIWIGNKGSDRSTWSIQGSNDGTTYTTISTTATPTTSDKVTLTSTDNTPYEYLRFYTSSGLCPSGSGGYFTRIAEVTFYSALPGVDKILDYKQTYFDTTKYILDYTKPQEVEE